MSILKKVENLKADVKRNKGVEHAAAYLAESSLGKRCPNLVEAIESKNAEEKYAAATLVQLMENTVDYAKNNAGVDILKEDATSANSMLSPGVASLLPQVVDIVNIFYPQLISNYIADIQALDRQSGQIFVIKTIYSETAAGVEAGDIVFEKATDGTYSSESISYEAVAIAGNNAQTSVAAPAAVAAAGADATVKIRAGSFIVYVNGKEVARDYGGGTKVDGTGTTYSVIGHGVSGTLNAQTGAATLVFDKDIFAAEIAAAAKASFVAAFDTEVDVDLIRKIQFEIPNQPVLATEHPLMSSYSVAAGLVMNAHLAIDIDELISKQLAGTIAWERDLTTIKKTSDAAALDANLTFDCSANGQNLTLQQRYSSYTTTISTARGIIQEKAGRGTVEFIICSTTQGLPIIEQIEGFKAAPESKKPIGPYLAGTLREGTIAVIAVPYTKTLAADQVIFGFKGFQLGDSAIVLAEWVPLYMTPTFQAPNLKNHKGCLSFYDLFVNKPEYLIRGVISNFNIA